VLPFPRAPWQKAKGQPFDRLRVTATNQLEVMMGVFPADDRVPPICEDSARVGPYHADAAIGVAF
jgi:hypothetical protein